MVNSEYVSSVALPPAFLYILLYILDYQNKPATLLAILYIYTMSSYYNLTNSIMGLRNHQLILKYINEL